VGAQVLWAHFNPVVFPEPQQFRPERFLERSYTPVEFMPFGGGIRRCIGAALAMYQMKLMLSTLLTTFDLAPANQQPIRYAQGAGSLEPMTPIKLLVRARRAS
jgi:cytochrome P450